MNKRRKERCRPFVGTEDQTKNCLVSTLREDLFEVIAKEFDGKSSITNEKLVKSLHRLDRRGRAFSKSRPVGANEIEFHVTNVGKQVYPVADFLDRVRFRNTKPQTAAATA